MLSNRIQIAGSLSESDDSVWGRIERNLEAGVRWVGHAISDLAAWLLSALGDSFAWIIGAFAGRWVDDVATWVWEIATHVPQLAQDATRGILYGLVLVALFLIALTMWKRMRRVSLIVRAFIDGAVNQKIGPGIAAMIEERLVGALRRKEAVQNGYELDFVTTDIDLLTEDNNLAKALERLADVPQFQLVVGVLDLIERLLPSRGLAAAGELLPQGTRGVGISLALYEGNRLTSRSSLWEKEVDTWLPGGEQDEEEGTGGTSTPYYKLAYPAAWWIQYEAARVLDTDASQVTASGRSFALVGLGLSRERIGRPKEAEEAYARALTHDADNVAALVNLAQLLARNHEAYSPAAMLLMRANDVFLRHYSETRR